MKSAVVKQTDSKTAVLTTAAQEADKTYTVSVGEEKVGTFKGISAVIPTAIKLTTPSVQGTIGKEVTVSAEVTVPDGQSKAGIPVTFNIVNDNANLNNKIEVVAYTNESGVASYSYTRYYKNNDNVTAYATDKASVFAAGKVYWAQSLTLTEVTEGNTLSNGAKKVYKVVAPDYAGGYVNIAFAENVDVTPDKLVRAVTVTDVATYSGSYPYQVSTSGKQEVRVAVNAKGEATFTLTGANAAVTPIAFIDGSFETVGTTTTWKAGDGKLSSQELQVKAPTVKFELSHTLELSAKALGTANAASITAGGTGGREYEVTVRDKDGKLAPKGTKAYVTFETGNLSPDRKVYVDDVETAVNKVHEIVVDKDGIATFVLTGNKDGFATPTIFLNNGSSANLSLDKSDLQIIGESTYFVDPVITDSALKVTNSLDKAVKSIQAGEVATFTYSSVDQNGFPYFETTSTNNGRYEVSFEVTARFSDVYVTGFSEVKQGTTKTFKTYSTKGIASIDVTSPSASNVTVNASASQVSLPNKSASVEFTVYATNDIVGKYVTADYKNNLLTLEDVNGKSFLYNYTGGKLLVNSGVVSEGAFENALTQVAVNPAANTLSVKEEDGVLVYNVILGVPAPTPAPTANVAPTIVGAEVISANQLQLTFSEAVTGVAAANYTVRQSDNTLVATGTAQTGSGTTWIITTDNAINVAAATTVEYVGTTTVDTAIPALPLVSGSKFAPIKQSAGLKVLASTTAPTTGISPINGVQSFDVTGSLASLAGTSETVTLVGAASTVVPVTFTATATTAAEVAKEIAAAINANTTANAVYTATTDGIRVILTGKTPAAAPITDLTFGTATAAVLDVITGPTTTAVAATPASSNFVVTGNLSGSAISKNVTITVNGSTYTKAVLFAATDNTNALAAQRIAATFTADGSLTGFTVTEASGELVVAQTATAAAPTTINVTIN